GRRRLRVLSGGGARAVPADGAIHSVLGRLGHQSPGTMTGVGGASLDWDRRRRVTPVQTTSQEAWPEAEPLGWNNSLRREPRWNAALNVCPGRQAAMASRFVRFVTLSHRVKMLPEDVWRRLDTAIAVSAILLGLRRTGES